MTEAHFPLKITCSGLSEDQKNIVDTLQSLVNGVLGPEAAAKAIDQIIVDACVKAHAEYTAKVHGSERGPDPIGWQYLLFDCVVNACIHLPAKSAAQDRLIDFLRQLQQLPRHFVPQFVQGEIVQKELWLILPENHYENFNDCLNFLERGAFHPASRWDETNSIAFTNFSAFTARLLSCGVVATVGFNPLEMYGVFLRTNLSNETVPKHFASFVSAAAQWIKYAGDALYEMCQKKTISVGGPDRWDRYRRRFEDIARLENLGSSTCQLAAEAALRMAKIEQRGVQTNLVDHFGIMQLIGDTYISNRPGTRGYVAPEDRDREGAA